MKRSALMLSASALLFVGTASPLYAQEAAADALKTPKEELSYVLGLDMGKSLKNMKVDVDMPALMLGVEHFLNDQAPLLDEQRSASIKQAFIQKMREQMAAEASASAEKNLEEGNAFLAENKTKEGVQTTESGLQYQVIKQGDGPKPKDSDKVTVHYRGTLLDGSEFDSSYARDKPATFPVKGVIPGWTEALQLMPVGSTYKLFIPAALAYGDQAAGSKIAPNSTLIFEVELLEIAQ